MLRRPNFRNRFLRDVWSAFEQRAKSLSHRGRLDLVAEIEERDFEWLGATVLLHGGLALHVTVTEHPFVEVRVTSRARVNRGRILLRLEGLRPYDRPARILDLFERTIGMIASHTHLSAGTVLPSVADAWRRVGPRPLTRGPD